MSMPRYDCRMLSAIGKYLFHHRDATFISVLRMSVAV